MTLSFAYISAALWVLSSLAWIMAARVDAPIREHPKGGAQSISIFTESDKPDEWMSVNGLTLPSASAFFAYQRKVRVWNSVAAALGAAGGFCAAISVALSA